MGDQTRDFSITLALSSGWAPSAAAAHKPVDDEPRGQRSSQRGGTMAAALRYQRLIGLNFGFAFLLCCVNACTEKTPTRIASTGSMYEAHCKEPLPVFTLGEHSNPTKDQEATLCACIWEHLGSWERRTSKKMTQGKDGEISWLYRTAFPPRLGKAIAKCGGMNL